MKNSNDSPRPVSELIKKEFGFDPDGQGTVGKNPEDNEGFNQNFKPISLSELMSKEFSDIQWIVEQLMPAEAIVAISGLPSAYKTWLILCLAIEVARGGVLFDKFVTTKTGVLIIDEETGERWMKQRVSKLRCEMDLPIYLQSRTGFKLTESSVKQLLSFAKEKEIKLIIFDSLLRIHTARNENDAVEMAKVFNLFQKLNREGITTAFTHHNRKPGLLRSSNPSQDMRGSSDILAAVDCHLAIERKDEAIVITQTKLRQDQEIKPFKLNIINDDNELKFEFAGEVDEEQTKKADWKESIKNYLSEQKAPKYKTEMFDQLKGAGVEGGYSTFKTAVKEMLDKGELFEKRGEKNKVYCSLKPSTEEQIPIEEGTDNVG
ncbi:MAG: AAA family ATPase [Bacteroidota bacterium]